MTTIGIQSNDFRNLTTPEEARQFVDATGIDILAPAVGNMHGMLKSIVQGKAKKHLDLERIAKIKQEPMMSIFERQLQRASTSSTSIPNYELRGSDRWSKAWRETRTKSCPTRFCGRW
jgi:hypothetical protein